MGLSLRAAGCCAFLLGFALCLLAALGADSSTRGSGPTKVVSLFLVSQGMPRVWLFEVQE